MVCKEFFLLCISHVNTTWVNTDKNQGWITCIWQVWPFTELELSPVSFSFNSGVSNVIINLHGEQKDVILFKWFYTMDIKNRYKYYSFSGFFLNTNTKMFFLFQRKICYGEQEIMQMQDYMRKPRTILPLLVTDFSLYMHKLPTSLLQNARMFMEIQDFPIDILIRSVRNTMTFQWLSFLPWENSFFF